MAVGALRWDNVSQERFKRTDMHLWYGIKGTVDKKLSSQLEVLEAQGYPFKYKIFTELGHGGLVGEHPEQFLEEMIKAHES